MARQRLRTATARLVLESAQAFLALLCVLTSVGYIFGVPQPESVDALLPPPIRWTWGGYLLVGGVFTLAGVVAGRRWLEKAGLWLLGGSALAYAFCVLAYGHLSALFVAAVVIAFGLSFAVQAIDRLQHWALSAIATDARV